MNEVLSSAWLHGNYIVNGYQVTIKTNLSIARFRSIDDIDDIDDIYGNSKFDYNFQGSEADAVIEEIADIWNKSDITQEEAVGQWISMHL